MGYKGFWTGVLGIICCLSALMRSADAAYTTAYVSGYAPLDHYIKLYFGCTPTAAASILAYWDVHGYGNFIQGNSANEIADNVASLSHIQTWYTDTAADIANRYVTRNSLTAASMADYGDVSEYVNNSIADFMGSSRGSYGSSVWQRGFTANGDTLYKATDDARTNLNQGLIDYAAWRGYDAYAEFVPFSSTNTMWAALQAEIDAGRPVVLIVNDTAGGAANHAVPVFGYRYDGTDREYYFYTMRDGVATGYWTDFKSPTTAVQWSVTGMQIFDPTRSAPVYAASAAVAIASGQTVLVNGGNLAAVKGTAARALGVATNIELQARAYYLDYTTVSAALGSTVSANGLYSLGMAIGNGCTLSLAGAVNVLGANAAAVYLNGADNVVTVESTGVISSTATSDSYGIFAQGYRNTIYHFGSITTSNLRDHGVYLNAFSTIDVQSTGTITTLGSNAHGINAQTQNTIDVQGSISTTGAAAHAVYMGTGNVLTVRASLTTAQATSYAVYADAAASYLKNVVNVVSGASFGASLYNNGAAGNAQVVFGGAKDIDGNVTEADTSMVFSLSQKILGANRWVGEALAGETYLNASQNDFTTFTVANGATLGGSGTISVTGGLTNHGALSPGSHASVGTLTVNGTYTQKSDGETVIDLVSSGTVDRLASTDVVFEGGRLLVRGFSSLMPFSQSYVNVFWASNSLSGFNTLSVVSTPLCAVTARQNGTAVDLDVTVKSLSSVAVTSQQSAAAEAFDTARGSGGDSAAVFDALAALASTADVTAAYDAMAGRSSLSVPQLMGQNASSAVQAVSGRMEMLRAGYLSPIGGLAFGDLRPDRDGYHFESRDDFFLGLGSAQGIEGARVPGCGVWAKADEVWGDAETTDERTGYRHRGSLTTLGSDARMGEVTLGGSYGFGDGRADLADDARSDIDAKHYSGYAGWDDRIAYACAVLTYSRFAHQGYRPIVFPGIARTAIADYHSRRYTVYTEAGRRIPFAKRHEFTPLLGLEYSRYRQDAYREAGADSLDLLVEGLECDSFKASLGGSYAYRLHHEKAFEDRLVLRGRYSRETMGDDLSQTTAFAANSSRSFSMTGGKESRNEYLAGAGYALTLSDSLTFSLDHDSVFRRGSREQRLSTEVRWAF